MHGGDSYSSEAKASRVIICKFPVKLPFPVYSGLQRASTSRHIHSDGVPGRPAGIVRMCQYVFALYILSLVPDVRALACVGGANINEPGASGAAPPGLHLRASPYLMEIDVSCCFYTYT